MDNISFYLKEYNTSSKSFEFIERDSIILYPKSAFLPEVFYFLQKQKPTVETQKAVKMARSIESYFSYLEKEQENFTPFRQIEQLFQKIKKHQDIPFTLTNNDFSHISKNESFTEQAKNTLLVYRDFFEKNQNNLNMFDFFQKNEDRDLLTEINSFIAYIDKVNDLLFKKENFEQSLKGVHNSLMGSIHNNEDNSFHQSYLTKESLSYFFNTAKKNIFSINQSNELFNKNINDLLSFDKENKGYENILFSLRRDNEANLIQETNKERNISSYKNN